MRGRAESNSEVADLLGLLTERVAGEQVIVGLYHAMIQRLESIDKFAIVRGTLDRFLLQELRHTRLLERAIRRLGGNPAMASRGSRQLGVFLGGLQKIVQDSSASFPEALEAMLMAVLCERVGWENLINLADRKCLSFLNWEFRGALMEEKEQESVLTVWRNQSVGAELRLGRVA